MSPYPAAPSASESWRPRNQRRRRRAGREASRAGILSRGRFPAQRRDRLLYGSVVASARHVRLPSWSRRLSHTARSAAGAPNYRRPMWRVTGELVAAGVQSGSSSPAPGSAPGLSPGDVLRRARLDAEAEVEAEWAVSRSSSSSGASLAPLDHGVTSPSVERWAGARTGDADAAVDVVDGVAVDEAPGSVADIREPPSAQDGVSSGSQAALLCQDGEQTGIMAARAYQIEMLEQSLERNVIVAMDTGSGKTQVAVLRIKAELESCDPKKIIWFIAPTVSLCAQQHTVFKLQIPGVSMAMLAGNSNINAWAPEIWSSLLGTARIVISTPQVLLDALDHAYISMNHLALIVFDEAHNCVGKNPGGKVMLNHYRPRKLAGETVPSILGLTATPSIQSEKEGLEALELLLDARCVSPTLHRDELLKCVKRPTISHVIYNSGREGVMTPTMSALNQVYLDLDIREDPYIHNLLRDPTDRNKRKLAEAIEKYDTYTQNQMKSFCFRSKEICKQLGPWVADLYIWKAISAHLNKVEGDHELANQWSTDVEKKYLAQVYRRVNVQPPPKTPQAFDDISDKVGRLLTELLSADESTVGIVFVAERVMVTMVAEVLSINQAIMAKYKIGTMVGTSPYATRRKAMYEFGDKTDYKDLLRFRQGKINLLIATSVLEEGIDVPACNLVICFDTPTTSKSFIQRRGRARKKDSNLVIFFEQANPALQRWEAKEEEMKKLFDDEQRQFHEIAQQEENSESPSDIFFIVPSTGARLEFDNAKAHLEHFCRVLSTGEFVDSRPDYIIQQDVDSKELTCNVLLPSFLPANLRKHSSASAWKTEKNATKDASYQAYRALYDAELVNDNLQPFKSSDLGGIDARASEVPVGPMMKPWHHVAAKWREPVDKWLYSLTCIGEDGQVKGEYEIVLPVQIDQPQPLQMYLDRSHNMELRLSAGTAVPHEKVADLPDHTSTLLALHFGHRWPIEPVEHVIRIWAKDESLSMNQIGELAYDPDNNGVNEGQYLIRDNTKSPYLYKDTIGFKPAMSEVQNAFYEYEKAPDNVPYLVLTKWTRRTDFLHRLQGDPTKDQVSSRPYPRVYPSQWATVDTIPAKHVHFGMTIPSIIHELGVMIMAKELVNTTLWDVGISNLHLVREAICARSASEPVNYERLEFLGDSILKFFTCIRVTAQYPDYPEGYLSHRRDRLISNARLYKTALEFNLPRFLITKPFTGQKWRPLYLDAVLQEDTETTAEKRKLSTKTLADMVEALIGVSYVDGHLEKAVKCISVFLPEANWTSVDEDRRLIFDRVPADEPLPPILEPLERLLGYTFQKKALLTEALTHASYAADTGKRSLERLEFLGDAILDNIIVTRLFDVKPELPHFRMHTLKTGLVNGDFLAFMTMEHGLKSIENIVTEDGNVESEETTSYLWTFMRHASMPIAIEQKETIKRHEALREEILDAMENGTHYPWALLAALNPKKFYSDVFEAILGAVWVDSGTMDECRDVAARFGLLKYLDRLLRDEVHVQHPKEELGKWANTETVTYELDMKESEETALEKEFFCKILVGKREVVSVRGGINKEEVKTKAATEAMKILEQEKRNGEGDVVMGE